MWLHIHIHMHKIPSLNDLNIFQVLWFVMCLFLIYFLMLLCFPGLNCKCTFNPHRTKHTCVLLTHFSQPSSFCSPADRHWASAPCTRVGCPPWQPASSEGSWMTGHFVLVVLPACAAPSLRSACEKVSVEGQGSTGKSWSRFSSSDGGGSPLHLGVENGIKVFVYFHLVGVGWVILHMAVELGESFIFEGHDFLHLLLSDADGCFW